MKIAGILTGVGLVAAVVVYLNLCPCGPVPGAWLFGDSAEGRVSDWSFVNDREAAPLCQVQISTWRPHSINLNCMASDGNLYVSCSNCAGKSWSNDALTNPKGHIRVAGTVYPVTLRRVTDDRTLDIAWQARLQKIAAEPQPRPDHWWSFHLVSRAQP